jgi:hypothetical protein
MGLEVFHRIQLVITSATSMFPLLSDYLQIIFGQERISRMAQPASHLYPVLVVQRLPRVHLQLHHLLHPVQLIKSLSVVLVTLYVPTTLLFRLLMLLVPIPLPVVLEQVEQAEQVQVAPVLAQVRPQPAQK